MHDTHPFLLHRTAAARGAVRALGALALLAAAALLSPAVGHANDGARRDGRVPAYPGTGALVLDAPAERAAGSPGSPGSPGAKSNAGAPRDREPRGGDAVDGNERDADRSGANGPGSDVVEALLLDTRLALEIEGLLGELTLTQTFRNTTDRWLDGTYLFPLPPDAAVRGLELRVGERIVVGRVQRRDEARETFERARASGQVAGLVEQQRPNLFTARLASIAPGGEIRVALDVLLPIEASDEALSLTLPTTLTPRYANAHVPDAPAVDGPILPGRVIRGPRFALDARVRPLADPSLVTSDTHRLVTDGDRITLHDAPMDRDLVLEWPFASGDAPASDAFVARHDGERYVQLFMAPPAVVDDASVAARELVLVVDTSGSMAGTSIVAARAAARSALDGLRPDDTFELIAFDDDTRTLFGGARPATPDNLAAAHRFVRRLEADGGTEMAPALLRALNRTGEDSGGRLRQVVFLTDGSIADEARLLGLIRRDIGRSRLFTVGIGAAPNGWFLDKAAEAGRGTALAVRDVDDVESAVGALLGRLERPVLTDIEVRFPDGGGEPYPARVPDLYASSPLMVVARLDGGGGEAVVSGWRGETRFERRIALPDPARSADGATTVSPTASDASVTPDLSGTSSTSDMSGGADALGEYDGHDGHDVAPSLAMHWARAKIAALLDEQRESHDAERHREAVTALALDVGLVTPYTSFVAVERTPVRPRDARRGNAEVANLLPAGNAMMAVVMPQGAAGIDTLGLLGAACALLGTLLLGLGRRLGAVGRRDEAAFA